MKHILTTVALYAAAVVANKRDLCSEGSTDEGGNYYCQAVDAITYTGVGGSGTYDKIVLMDADDSTCDSTPQTYSGNLAPFDEEVSLHFRGPLDLLQFAFYTTSSSQKARRSEHVARHAHAHAHAHGHMHKARNAAVGDEVYATIDGQLVSWVNEYSGAPATSSSSSATPAATPSSYSVLDAAGSAVSAAASAASSLLGGGNDDDSSSSSSGSWKRQGYYNSKAGSSEGLVFLNHEGGSGSGTFDYAFGNSLSYSSADGCEGASEPTTLGNVQIPSSGEVVIMTDSKCSGDSCGYYRPNTTAYHGFDGPSKAFFFQFQMPSDGQTGASKYVAVDMPAIWMLNAQIPRTLQYGEASCSCWTSGCGEFDIFEVLSPGSTKAKSTIHGNIAGGCSDYFVRPTEAPIQVGVVLYEDNFHIKIIDDSIDISDVSDSVIQDIVSSTTTQTKTVSLFNLDGLSGDSSA